ncbi:MAG: ABC transporter ATP-binding protein [Eubacteriales bacterium]|nr:ABC transporter ATP-binding protein [Eubacteriales bacterium]
MQTLKSRIKIYFFLLGLTWRASKKLVLALIATGVSQILRLLINVFIPKYLIDGLSAGLELKNYIIWGLFLLFSNVVLARIPGFSMAFAKSTLREVGDYFSYFMAEKVMDLDFSYMEDKEYIGLKEQADFLLVYMRPHVSMIIYSIDLMKAAGVVLSVLAIALSFSLPLLLILLLLVLIQMQQGRRSVRAVNRFVQALKVYNAKIMARVRFAHYPDKQMDARLLCREAFFSDRYYDVIKETLKDMEAVDRQQGLSLGVIAAINVIGEALCYAYTAIRAVSNLLGPQISLGSFAMYVSALTQFNANFVQLSMSTMNLSNSIAIAEPLYEFMTLPRKKTGAVEEIDFKLLPPEEAAALKLRQEVETSTVEPQPVPDAIEELRFEGVYFKYPAGSEYVLRDFSAVIRRGEKISIVGLNGAGKTTVVKLLMRLYTPQAGTIKLNGIDIQSFEVEEYQAKVSVIFQDYKLFNLSIAENIACVKDYDPERIAAVLKEVGLDAAVAALPQGVDSILGKDLVVGGIELSGGERQKIAIARALYKNAELVILDEPTSALDPKSEAEIYENFYQLTANRTAIFISHRLSSSLFCDKILLLQDGRVQDFDTHQKLMQKTDSLYYKMFTTQQQNYLLE